MTGRIGAKFDVRRTITKRRSGQRQSKLRTAVNKRPYAVPQSGRWVN